MQLQWQDAAKELNGVEFNSELVGIIAMLCCATGGNISRGFEINCQLFFCCQKQQAAWIEQLIDSQTEFYWAILVRWLTIHNAVTVTVQCSVLVRHLIYLTYLLRCFQRCWPLKVKKILRSGKQVSCRSLNVGSVHLKCFLTFGEILAQLLTGRKVY